MIRISFLMIFMTCFLQLNAKSELEIQWEKANQYYATKEYNRAIEQYSQILKESNKTSLVYYNLGNAYFRTDNFDKAVLCYKIALLKDHGNKKIQDNLSLARYNQTKPTPEAKPIFFERWWQSLMHFVAPSIWAALGFLLFLVIVYSFYAQKTGKKTIPYFNRYISAYVSLFILLLILAFASTNTLNKDKKAIMVLERELNV